MDKELVQSVGILARAMAFIAINTGPSAQLKVGEKAIALEALGLKTAEEQAALLGSTPGAIRQLKSEVRGAAKGGNGGKKSKAQRRRGRQGAGRR